MWRAFIILYAAYILAKKNERLEKHACGSAAGRLLSWDSTPGSRHWFLFTCLCHHLHQCHTMPSNLIPEPLTPPSSMKRRREREWGRQTSTCRAFAAFGTFLICFTPERKFWKVSVTFPNLQRRKLITEKFKVTVLKERQLCGSKFHVLYTVHGLPLWLSWWRTCLQCRFNPCHWEDPLEKGTAAHSSILAWRIPWTVQSMGSQRVRHDWVTFTHNVHIWFLKNGKSEKVECPG